MSSKKGKTTTVPASKSPKVEKVKNVQKAVVTTKRKEEEKVKKVAVIPDAKTKGLDRKTKAGLTTAPKEETSSKKRPAAAETKGPVKRGKQLKPAATENGSTERSLPEEVSVSKGTKKRVLEVIKKEPIVIDTSKRPTKEIIQVACEALFQHVEEYEKAKKQKTLSLPGVSKDGQSVFLQIGLRTMPEQAIKTFKGRPIPLPHPFRDIETSSVCMFVKDKPEAKKWLGDDYEKHGIKKIISLQQLRTDYKAFEDKRELADLYDVFVADDRIVTMLPKALGKIFYVGAKRPLPIRLAQREKLDGDVTAKLRKTLGSAYYYLSGTSNAMRVGTTNQGLAEIIANVEVALNAAVEYIPGKWSGVQSVFVKTEKSAALPLYEGALTKQATGEE